MNITSSVLEHFLKLLSVQQEVCARNISNANTPNYKSLGVEIPSDFKALASQLSKRPWKISLQTTSLNHIPSSRPHYDFSVYELNGQEVKPNGNNVSVSEESLKLSKNQIKYEQVAVMYKKINELLSIASGKSGTR